MNQKRMVPRVQQDFECGGERLLPYDEKTVLQLHSAVVPPPVTAADCQDDLIGLTISLDRSNLQSCIPSLLTKSIESLR